MAACRVRALLMGGQACVFYGAAEFSRDTDLLILADAENLRRLDQALRELQAERIAVPPLSPDYLQRGHAVHFRCHHPEAAEMRVDVMSQLRGVDRFEHLWERRTSVTDTDGTRYELLSLPDLVKAKKTQRGKDWPMLQRLLEAHYLQHRTEPTPERRRFWLLELRTAALLVEAAASATRLASELVPQRALISLALSGQTGELEAAFQEEEREEREADRAYWQPLKLELERLRHASTKS
ncbi:MAG: hypothetical protein MUE94_06420 [Verrucomicrobia bacterium]|jgi:hypothetical protein|nr:hypothetical protein [Verrucomicrobiota bacterium]